MITKRQENILEVLVRDYINSAQPISSEFLEKKHKFGLSPATLRIEMQKLTDGGYLIQPHTSAGRVPTDRGYRFFVDKIMEDVYWNKGSRLFFLKICFKKGARGIVVKSIKVNSLTIKHFKTGL